MHLAATTASDLADVEDRYFGREEVPSWGSADGGSEIPLQGTTGRWVYVV